jgi:hypothetical protein
MLVKAREMVGKITNSMIPPIEKELKEAGAPYIAN